ncbi:hypothetical protein AMJ50_01555 [Parcubacteria bacterium DG_74_3]|nr:MAG: hypothetical protein AMJ50_01555 [Parcubacteria bacterium DG_74_3]
MKRLLTSDLKVQFLGITPLLKDKGGVLNPQHIVSLSALLTFKGKSIKDILKKIKETGENLNVKTRKILEQSSLKGHASVATTPSLCIAYEGSKFLDSVLTGIVFSSSIVSSGRRTTTAEKDIVYPNGIIKNKKARKIYENISKRLIKSYNFFLSQGIPKDETSKILQYGIYGTGIIQLPIESIVLLKREYLIEKEWMPQELEILLKKIEKKLKKLGVDLLYTTRVVAPRNIYPYPNIFKNPKKQNLVREFLKKEKLLEGSKLVSLEILEANLVLKRKLIELNKKRKRIFSSFSKIKKEWPNLLSQYQEILRDYNLVLKFRFLSSVPWRIWGEKKRHRTCPQVVESIYYCIERTIKIFHKFKNQIEKRKINKNTIKKIEKFFSIPPSIKKNPKFLSEYLLVALNSLEGYQKLIKLKIKPREAIFLIPRGLKIDILQEYDLYNLLTGYYPLRLCQTSEEEMKRNTWIEVKQIKKALSQKRYGWLNEFIIPKCQIVGFCPEEKSCGIIKRLIKNYSENFHQEMKKDLEKKFEEKFKNLGKT